MTRDRFTVVVHLLLLRELAGSREVFLLRRAGTGFMDGYYVLPGGHLQHGESLAHAAVRECREETGVTPGKLRPQSVLPYRSGRHQGINVVFQASELSGEPGIGEPDRCDCVGWFSPARLPVPAARWIADVLDLESRGEWFRELTYAP